MKSSGNGNELPTASTHDVNANFESGEMCIKTEIVNYNFDLYISAIAHF